MGGGSAPAPAPSPSDVAAADAHTSSGGGHEGPVSIFGIIVTLDSNVGAYAFIGFLIGLVVMEYCIEKLEKIAEAKGLAPLFHKLQKELMMMGVISFGVFIYQTAAHPPAGSILLEAMEMTHIIVLFMALAFIVQAFFLVTHATVAGVRYLTIMRTSSEALVDEYRALERNPRLNWWFHHGSSLIPGTCRLRTKIETRIIERLFVRQHNLPPEFNFAQYISILFETYTAELGEVSPLSWGLLAVLVLANYFRTAVIDSGDGGAASCHTDDGSDFLCQYYIVAYSYIAAAFLTVIIIGLYIASSIYVDRMIVESLSVDGIVTKKGQERFSYIKSLECMIRKDKMLMYQESIRDKTKQGIEGNLHDGTKGHGKTEDGSYLDSLSSILEATKLFQKREVHMHEVQEKKGSVKSLLVDVVRGGGSTKTVPGNGDEKHDETAPDWLSSGGGHGHKHTKVKSGQNLSKIFFLKWPSLFFHSIEAALLFQCFYISIVATQLIPLVSTWRSGGGYVVAYLVIMAANFFVITLIIDKSVVLRSVFKLERDVAGKVCEDTMEIKHSIETFRSNLLAKFTADNIPQDKWKDVLKGYFAVYDNDGSGVIDENEFREILSDLKIYMSRESFKFLWQALDFDLSGELTWAELFDVVFPAPKEVVIEDETLRVLRDALQTMVAEQNIPVKEWEIFVKSKFLQFDENGSGEIDQKEFADMLAHLNISIPPESIQKVFKLVNQDDDEGLISFGEFWELMFPSGSAKEREVSEVIEM